jgi:hypothetical protein
MKKPFKLLATGLLGIFTSTLSFGQSTPASISSNSDQSYAVETRYVNNSPSAFAELKKKSLHVDLEKKEADLNTDRKGTFNSLQFSKFFAKSTAITIAEEKTLNDGTLSISLKEATSLIGNIAIKEANVVYDNAGLVSINMNMDNVKGRAFLAAHLAKLGQPNNEEVIDNPSWIIDNYFLEIMATPKGFTAIYKKRLQLNCLNCL